MALKNTFSRIVAAIRTNRNETDRGILRFFGLTNAGVNVNHEVAMQVAAVWACIDVIASSLASSDWNVYGGIRGAANKRDMPDDNLQYLLNTRWNPECTAQSAKRAMMIAAVGYGNGVAEIERDMAGRIVGLWPILPDRVELRRAEDNGELIYRITLSGTGGFVDLTPDQVLHIRGPGLTGFMGDDVLNRAVKSISQAVAMDAFTSAYFGNSAQLGTVFMYKNAKLDDTHYSRLSKSLEKRHVGAGKAFTTAILDGGEWDVKQIGSDADKAQIIAAKHLSIEEICRWYHVPPHKVAHLLRSSNNNIEHQGLEFTRDTLRPWAKEIEQESDYKLVPYRGPRKFVEIDMDWAQQGDYKSRLEAYQIGRNMGVFSANDILRKLGENTIGEDGDIRIVQGAMIKLEDVGAAYDAQADALEAAAPPEPDDTEGEDEAVMAWLESVYERIERRRDNREKDLARTGKESFNAARDDAQAYSIQELAPFAKVLNKKQLALAHTWAAHVIGGCSPKIAAVAALEKKL